MGVSDRVVVMPRADRAGRYAGGDLCCTDHRLRRRLRRRAAAPSTRWSRRRACCWPGRASAGPHSFRLISPPVCRSAPSCGRSICGFGVRRRPPPRGPVSNSLGPVCRLALSAGGLVLEADVARRSSSCGLGAVPGRAAVTLPHDRLMVFPAMYDATRCPAATAMVRPVRRAPAGRPAAAAAGPVRCRSACWASGWCAAGAPAAARLRGYPGALRRAGEYRRLRDDAGTVGLGLEQRLDGGGDDPGRGAAGLPLCLSR